MNIRFKETPGDPGKLERDWPRVHPELRRLLLDFDGFCERRGLHPPVITELGRSRAEQVRTYVRWWKKLVAALLPGLHHMEVDPEDDGTWRPLTVRERDEALEIRALDEEGLRLRAEKKFTWHWVWAAADLRSRDPRTGRRLYSTIHPRDTSGRLLPSEADLVDEWFRTHCPKPVWEYLQHDVTAPHIHVARRDFFWRTKHSQPNPEVV